MAVYVFKNPKELRRKKQERGRRKKKEGNGGKERREVRRDFENDKGLER